MTAQAQKTAVRPADAKAPRQKRAQETHENLLAAAVDLFSERGYDGASTRDIEAAAGVNRGLIAYHFGSKEELWKEAVDGVFLESRKDYEGFSEVAEGLSPRARLEFVIRAFVRFCARHPELHRIMVHEGKTRSWRIEWLVERHVRPYFELTKSAYEAARAAGLAPALPHEHVHYVLVGAAALAFAVGTEFELVTGKRSDTRQAVEAHADTMIALVLGPDHGRQI